MPISGEIVKCDMCGKPYPYYIWAFGSDKCLCKLCVLKRPQSYLAWVDAIDIFLEDDIIADEIHEENKKGLPTRTSSRNTTKRPADGKSWPEIWKTLAKSTKAKFKERS
jgi:hypothetical protein